MTTTPASAYPRDVDALMPDAYALTAQLGEIPTRNKLMTTFRIGAPKADAIRDALAAGYADSPVSPAVTATVTEWPTPPTPVTPTPQATGDRYPVTEIVPGPVPGRGKLPATWPLILLGFGAFVAIWSGWVGLGGMTGFGIVHPLPGIYDRFHINTAITLPIGVETYAAYAIRVSLARTVSRRARRFAAWSTVGSLILGAAGQVAYHLMVAYHITHTPWQVTIAVACLPVAVLGMGAALAHLIRHDTDQHKEETS